MAHVVSFLRSRLVQLWKGWTVYNPERHYMRGPGPKWREKHVIVDIADRGIPPMRIDGSDTVISSR